MWVTRTNTLGIRVDSIAVSDAPLLLDMIHCSTGPVLFTFVTPASVTAAKRHPGYRSLLEKFDVVLPDGIGMCWAVRPLHGLPTARISFDTTSLAPLVFQRARQDRLIVALIGGRPGVAERGAHQLEEAFLGCPSLQFLMATAIMVPRSGVTTQVTGGLSRCGQVVDQGLWITNEALDDPPSSLPGGPDERSDHGEILRPLDRAEAAGDLLLELHYPSVSLSLVVGERHVRVGQKPQDIGFALAETQQQVVPDTPWR